MSGPFLRDLGGDAFLAQANKRITLMGMSGVGKTTLGKALPSARWFHYSTDYRIGTRYLDEAIIDEVKREAMRVPVLAELLRTDSIYIGHNITVDNLKPLSTFLGMLGDPAKGGLSVEEFKRRLALHHQAEVNATRDVHDFIAKARDIYGYAHFLNDASGSLCELDDERTYQQLAEDTVLVYLKAPEAMREALIARAVSHPKPLYYRPEFLDESLDRYLGEKRLDRVDAVDPADFVRWVFVRLVAHRLPRYQRIADLYGVTVDAGRLSDIKNEDDVLHLVAEALDARRPRLSEA